MDQLFKFQQGNGVEIRVRVRCSGKGEQMNIEWQIGNGKGELVAVPVTETFNWLIDNVAKTLVASYPQIDPEVLVKFLVTSFAKTVAGKVDVEVVGVKRDDLLAKAMLN